MNKPRETILDNQYVNIWHYPTEGIIHHQFHRYIYGDPFREILMAGLAAFETNKCTKWLSDDRNFGAIFPEDKIWGDKVWRPRVLKAGWRYWAMVLPEKVTGKMNLQKMVDEYEQEGIITRVYNEPDEGMKWLIVQQ